jgi:hypothetical protein
MFRFVGYVSKWLRWPVSETIYSAMSTGPHSIHHCPCLHSGTFRKALQSKWASSFRIKFMIRGLRRAWLFSTVSSATCWNTVCFIPYLIIPGFHKVYKNIGATWKILGARRFTGSKLRSKEPQISGATVQKLADRALRICPPLNYYT